MLWEFFWRNKNSLSLSFCLLFSSASILWQTNPFAKGVNFLGKVTDRVSGALNSGLQIPGVIWVEIDKYRELEKRYASAQERLEEYRLEKDKFDTLKRENSQLRELLSYQPREDYKEVRAEVLGIRLNSISPRIIIGKGSDDGIRTFMPVITRAHDSSGELIQCVVGVVASVDSRSSVIQPILHSGFRMGVRIPSSGQWAILSGNSGSITNALLTYISYEESPDGKPGTNQEKVLSAGDYVYSSGEGGIFPEGIPVGIIEGSGPRKGDFSSVYLRPFAPIGTLDNVSVLLKQPAPWSKIQEKEFNWNDHLLTEFGPPVYPEIKEKPEAERAERTTTTPSETGSNGESPDENTTGEPEEEEPKQEPRIIQNVNPGGGPN